MQAAQERSIPACAGECFSDPVIGVENWVYPRVRGGMCKTGYVERAEQAGPEARHSQRWESAIGLSPRARGNGGLGRRDGVSRGSIPACARGNGFAGRLRQVPVRSILACAGE